MSNPVTKHIVDTIKALLTREVDEMKTAFGLFKEKRQQVTALCKSLNPLFDEDSEYQDALYECDLETDVEALLRETEKDGKAARAAVATMHRVATELIKKGQLNKEDRDNLATLLKVVLID